MAAIQFSREEKNTLSASGNVFCFECGSQDGDLKVCKTCGTVAYCSRNCQKQSWRLHRVHCSALAESPLRLRQFSDWRGRTMRTKRDIKRGELVWSEPPSLTVRECQLSSNQSPEKLRVQEERMREWFGKAVSTKLARLIRNLGKMSDHTNTVWYLVDTALRNKAWLKWRLDFYKTQLATPCRKGHKVVKFLAKHYKVTRVFVCRVYGLFMTNHFLVESVLHTNVRYGTAFYDYASFFNYSCNPNLWRVNQNGTHTLFIAVRDIQRGEPLTIAYNDNRISDASTTCMCGECHTKQANQDAIARIHEVVPLETLNQMLKTHSTMLAMTFGGTKRDEDALTVFKGCRDAMDTLLQLENATTIACVSGVSVMQDVSGLLNTSLGKMLRKETMNEYMNFRTWIWNTCCSLGTRVVSETNTMPAHLKKQSMLILVLIAMVHGTPRNNSNATAQMEQFLQMGAETLGPYLEPNKVLEIECMVYDAAKKLLASYGVLLAARLPINDPVSAPSTDAS